MKRSNKKKYLFILLLAFLGTLVQSTYYSDIPVDTLKQKYANEFSKFVEIDQMQVHYRDEGKGEVIVLIHGTGASLHTWDDWTQALKQDYRVVRLDLPAFGLTGANSNGDYSIKNYTSFLHKFLKTINVDSCYMAGSSLGGNIAWNYAVDYPEYVKKLILVNASGLPTGKSQPWIFKLAKTPVLNSMFLYITPKSIIKKNLEQVYDDDTKITESLVSRYHQMSLREGNRKAFIDRAKTDFKLSDSININRLRKVASPTLIIWGENDLWIPLENGEKMDKLIPSSELAVIKNSGHVPMEENPKESLDLVTQFLKEHK